jgi:archaellum component FlaC
MIITDFILHRYVIFLAIPIALSSCEDKALIQKEEDLTRRIADFEAEFAVMKAKADEDSKKHAESLGSINQKLAELSAEKLVIDNEYQDLKQSYEQINQAFLNFKEKHQIKETPGNQ